MRVFGASLTWTNAMKDYDEILISLRKIMRAADLHSQRLMKESGLTAPQLLVMQAIEKEGKPSTSTLARHIAVSQATMTRIVDRPSNAKSRHRTSVSSTFA